MDHRVTCQGCPSVTIDSLEVFRNMGCAGVGGFGMHTTRGVLSLVRFDGFRGGEGVGRCIMTWRLGVRVSGSLVLWEAILRRLVRVLDED